eukprot:gene20380-23151_t
MSFSSSFVQVNVGGIPYSIAVSDIEKFPGSFFPCMIKKEWKHNSAETISIQRDGALFKLVYAYLVNGHLPRDEEGLIDLEDATLDGLKEEADFYGLVGLSKECSVQRRSDLQSYLTIRKYISSLHRHGGSLRVDVSSQLVRALKCIWAPFCVSGILAQHPCFSKKFFRDHSYLTLDLAELIAVAKQSSFGRGTETVVDTSVRNSFEIDASLFDAAGLSVEDLSRAYDERHKEEGEEVNSDSDDENREYWGNQPKGRYERNEASAERGPAEADIAFIYEHLDLELENYDSIIICLQHLYPECQTNPAFLKGGDRVLYDILTSGGSALGKYEMQVVAATIYHSEYDMHEFPSESCGALFSPTIVKQRLRLINGDPGSDSQEKKETEAPLKKPKLNPTAALGLTKLVLFSDLESDSLLDYTPYNEHTGNEPQAEESVYIVAGLQVRSKV